MQVFTPLHYLIIFAGLVWSLYCCVLQDGFGETVASLYVIGGIFLFNVSTILLPVLFVIGDMFKRYREGNLKNSLTRIMVPFLDSNWPKWLLCWISSCMISYHLGLEFEIIDPEKGQSVVLFAYVVTIAMTMVIILVYFSLGSLEENDVMGGEVPLGIGEGLLGVDWGMSDKSLFETTIASITSSQRSTPSGKISSSRRKIPKYDQDDSLLLPDDPKLEVLLEEESDDEVIEQDSFEEKMLEAELSEASEDSETMEQPSIVEVLSDYDIHFDWIETDLECQETLDEMKMRERLQYIDKLQREEFRELERSTLGSHKRGRVTNVYYSIDMAEHAFRVDKEEKRRVYERRVNEIKRKYVHLFINRRTVRYVNRIPPISFGRLGETVVKKLEERDFVYLDAENFDEDVDLRDIRRLEFLAQLHLHYAYGLNGQPLSNVIEHLSLGVEIYEKEVGIGFNEVTSRAYKVLLETCRGAGQDTKALYLEKQKIRMERKHKLTVCQRLCDKGDYLKSASKYLKLLKELEEGRLGGPGRGRIQDALLSVYFGLVQCFCEVGERDTAHQYYKAIVDLTFDTKDGFGKYIKMMRLFEKEMRGKMEWFGLRKGQSSDSGSKEKEMSVEKKPTEKPKPKPKQESEMEKKRMESIVKLMKKKKGGGGGLFGGLFGGNKKKKKKKSPHPSTKKKKSSAADQFAAIREYVELVSHFPQFPKSMNKMMECGKSLILLGSSKVGKSTIIRKLMRLYPSDTFELPIFHSTRELSSDKFEKHLPPMGHISKKKKEKQRALMLDKIGPEYFALYEDSVCGRDNANRRWIVECSTLEDAMRLQKGLGCSSIYYVDVPSPEEFERRLADFSTDARTVRSEMEKYRKLTESIKSSGETYSIIRVTNDDVDTVSNRIRELHEKSLTEDFEKKGIGTEVLEKKRVETITSLVRKKKGVFDSPTSGRKSVIILGAPGVGKSTIIMKFMKLYPSYELPLIHTTRVKSGERYESYLPPTGFLENQADARNRALWMNKIGGETYAVLKDTLDDNTRYIFECERLEDALKLKTTLNCPHIYYLNVPSTDDLESRLKSRLDARKVRLAMDRYRSLDEEVGKHSCVIRVTNEDVEKAATCIGSSVSQEQDRGGKSIVLLGSCKVGKSSILSLLLRKNPELSVPIVHSSRKRFVWDAFLPPLEVLDNKKSLIEEEVIEGCSFGVSESSLKQGNWIVECESIDEAKKMKNVLGVDKVYYVSLSNLEELKGRGGERDKYLRLEKEVKGLDWVVRVVNDEFQVERVVDEILEREKKKNEDGEKEDLEKKRMESIVKLMKKKKGGGGGLFGGLFGGGGGKKKKKKKTECDFEIEKYVKLVECKDNEEKENKKLSKEQLQECGKSLILLGSSKIGKSTIVNNIMRMHPECKFEIPMFHTTRKMSEQKYEAHLPPMGQIGSPKTVKRALMLEKIGKDYFTLYEDSVCNRNSNRKWIIECNNLKDALRIKRGMGCPSIFYIDVPSLREFEERLMECNNDNERIVKKELEMYKKLNDEIMKMKGKNDVIRVPNSEIDQVSKKIYESYQKSLCLEKPEFPVIDVEKEKEKERKRMESIVNLLKKKKKGGGGGGGLFGGLLSKKKNPNRVVVEKRKEVKIGELVQVVKDNEVMKRFPTKKEDNMILECGKSLILLGAPMVGKSTIIGKILSMYPENTFGLPMFHTTREKSGERYDSYLPPMGQISKKKKKNVLMLEKIDGDYFVLYEDSVCKRNCNRKWIVECSNLKDAFRIKRGMGCRKIFYVDVPSVEEFEKRLMESTNNNETIVKKELEEFKKLNDEVAKKREHIIRVTNDEVDTVSQKIVEMYEKSIDSQLVLRKSSHVMKKMLESMVLVVGPPKIGISTIIQVMLSKYPDEFTIPLLATNKKYVGEHDCFLPEVLHDQNPNIAVFEKDGRGRKISGLCERSFGSEKKIHLIEFHDFQNVESLTEKLGIECHVFFVDVKSVDVYRSRMEEMGILSEKEIEENIQTREVLNRELKKRREERKIICMTNENVEDVSLEMVNVVREKGK